MSSKASLPGVHSTAAEMRDLLGKVEGEHRLPEAVLHTELGLHGDSSESIGKTLKSAVSWFCARQELLSKVGILQGMLRRTLGCGGTDLGFQLLGGLAQEA